MKRSMDAARGLSLFLLATGACAPDIVQNPLPGESIVAEFDPGAVPAVAPVPNDLALLLGHIVVPSMATDTPAQTEFNQTYLGKLTGFPQESTARVVFSGPLDPARVNSENVIVFDATAGSQVGESAPLLEPLATAIVVPPPLGAWKRAHQYAIALIGGAKGLRGSRAEPVIGSPTWALVSSPNPLVDCPKDAAGKLDFASAACLPLVDVIPSSATDPEAKLRDQAQKAIQLERIREGYAPILAKLGKAVDPRSIVLLWTFSIVDAGEVTFDPSRGIIPFPNDVLLSSATGTVALPHPKTGAPLTPADCAPTGDTMTLLYCGLNTLDGFSTIAPPISENGAMTGAIAQALVDPATLTPQSVGLMPVKSAAPPEEQTTPAYTPCLNCSSSTDANGNPQTSPQQLQWRLDKPLDERTTYLAYVTDDVHDDKGRSVVANPIFGLLRLKSRLSVDGKSQVNILTDAQAAALEPLRSALGPIFDALELKGVPREKVALAWTFTTQSEATLLDQLHAYANSPSIQALLPPGVLVFRDATAQLMGAAKASGAPVDGIAKFYVGVFDTAVAVTGFGGTFDLAKPKPEPVTFTLAVPDTTKVTPPASGYPITIFAHGFTRDRNDVLAIANSLAKTGQATVATDVLFHGERSSCTGSAAYLTQLLAMPTTDDAACADPNTMMCDEDPLIGRCVGRSAATPVASDFLRDAGGRPIISGWNIFNLNNFFSTRDNFRQQVIDLSQLVQVLPSIVARVVAAGGAPAFDLTRIGYVGQSLGGILGTLYNAVSPDTTNVVLNVAGGTLPQIVLDAPTFAPYKTALLDGLARQGIVPGTPAFDQFLGIAQWILDPADPANMGWRLNHPTKLANGTTAPSMKGAVFFQFIKDDPTVPNRSTLALLSTAAAPFFSPSPPSYGCQPSVFCYEFVDALEGFDAMTLPPALRHPFLLKPPVSTALGVALTAKAQKQVATFLATGNFQ
jgi:dienelactone hydrolase